VQAQGTTRNDTNLHVEPGRETEHLYQISSGEKLSLLKRGTADKSAAAPPSHAAAPASSKPGGNQPSGNQNENEEGKKPVQAIIAQPKPAPEKSAPEPAAPAREDWWLVRDSHNRVGWVLARMIDLDVPLDVAQYAEGQRIVAFFVLNEVQDGDKKVRPVFDRPHRAQRRLAVRLQPDSRFHLERKASSLRDGLSRAHGRHPARELGQESFDKEGTLPVFTIHVQDDKGSVGERKYKLNTPIVRRVLAPGEQPVRAVSRKAEGRKAKRRRKQKS
jgi:hypothetical protein